MQHQSVDKLLELTERYMQENRLLCGDRAPRYMVPVVYEPEDLRSQYLNNLRRLAVMKPMLEIISNMRKEKANEQANQEEAGEP